MFDMDIILKISYDLKSGLCQVRFDLHLSLLYESIQLSKFLYIEKAIFGVTSFLDGP